MYILCYKLPGDAETHRLVAANRRTLFADMAMDQTRPEVWRLFDCSKNGGWCDGSPDSWKHIHNETGEAIILMDCVG